MNWKCFFWLHKMNWLVELPSHRYREYACLRLGCNKRVSY